MTVTRTPGAHETRADDLTGGKFMDSDLSLDFLRVVEQAAIACAHTMGQGDAHKSDAARSEATVANHFARPVSRVFRAPPFFSHPARSHSSRAA